MNRVIKFRGKSINNIGVVGRLDYVVKIGDMVYGDLRTHDECCIDTGEHIVKVNPDTVGQFTGLYDKSGKEIYEGDIMGLPKCDAVGIEYKNRYVRVVEWINDGFFLVEHCEMGGELRKYGDRLALEISLKSRYAGIARCFKERGLDYTVIGNIHDNPELLKGGER